MEEYEILEELKMLIRCSDFAQNLSCDGVSVDFLKSTLDLILKQKSEIERNKSDGNSAENHGHWKHVAGMNSKCSVCERYFPVNEFVKRPFDINYCPNCGAKMEREPE